MDAYERLGHAITMRACDDYVRGMIALQRKFKEYTIDDIDKKIQKTQMKESRRLHYIAMSARVRSAILYFHGPLFSLLTDVEPDTVMKELDRRVAELDLYTWEKN